MELPSKISLKLFRKSLDEWLATEGYYRKRTPKDSTCLFRAVSEQIYSTQCYHVRVRRQVVEYMEKKRELFEKFVSVPYDFYLQQMSCVTEYGGPTEIQAMSLLYQRKIIVYDIEKRTCSSLTDNFYQNTIYLCRIPPRHYESLYPKSFITTAGFCQSIMYNLLYKNVLDTRNMDNATCEVSNDRDIALRHDHFFLKENLDKREELTAEIYNRMKSGCSAGSDAGDDAARNVGDNAGGSCWKRYYSKRLMKLLDPDVYRNVDLDVWNEIKREIKDVNRTSCGSFQVGDKCHVRMQLSQLQKEDFDKINTSRLSMEITKRRKVLEKQMTQHDSFVFRGYIQEMSKNEGSVLVFIEEFGEKRIVPYSSLARFADNRCSSLGANMRKKKASTNVDNVANRCKRDYAGNVTTNNNSIAVAPVTMTAVIPTTNSLGVFQTVVPTPYNYGECIEINESRQNLQQTFQSYAIEDLASNIENCTLSQDTKTPSNSRDVTQPSSAPLYCASSSYFCQLSPYISVDNSVEASSSTNEIHHVSLPFIYSAFHPDVNNISNIDIKNSGDPFALKCFHNSALEYSSTIHPWDNELDEQSVPSCNYESQLTAGTWTNFVQEQSAATMKDMCTDEVNVGERNKESPREKDTVSLTLQSVDGDVGKNDRHCEKPFDPSKSTIFNCNCAPVQYSRNGDTQGMQIENKPGESCQMTFVQQAVCPDIALSGNIHDAGNAIPLTGQPTSYCATPQPNHLPLSYATNYDMSNRGNVVCPLTLPACTDAGAYGIVCPILYSPNVYRQQQQISSWYVGLPLIQGVQHLSMSDHYCYCQYGFAPLLTTNSFYETQAED